jgi:hypothetical protein
MTVLCTWRDDQFLERLELVLYDSRKKKILNPANVKFGTG